MNLSNRQFQFWIYNRLEKIHGENPNTDYMRRLREMSEPKMPPDDCTECIINGEVRAFNTCQGNHGYYTVSVWNEQEACFSYMYFNEKHKPNSDSIVQFYKQIGGRANQ